MGLCRLIGRYFLVTRNSFDIRLRGLFTSLYNLCISSTSSTVTPFKSVCHSSPAEEMSWEQWKKVIDINLPGVFLTAQAAGRIMLRQGRGSIINTASMSAHIVNVPQPQCAYNASKAGVIQLTKSLAVEWADRGVRVNSLSPGYIGTALTLNSPILIPLIEQWNEMAPMHRLGKPEELQAICVYLASDASPFTTGADFTIDGAFTCF